MNELNKDAILKTAEMMETPIAQKHFYMGTVTSVDKMPEDDTPFAEVINQCGASCCLIGWAVLANKPDATYADVHEDAAAEIFGTDHEATHNLFYPCGETKGEMHLYLTDPLMGAKVLRHLAATGEVDWSKAFEDA